MKLSTKGTYGLRAMVDLAANSESGHVALKSIAERQGVSENYLEQVFSTLRKAGLVNSIKGAQGGYLLAESPAEIKVGTILRALEGNLSITDEGSKRKDLVENSIEECIKTHVWDKINESINKIADSITLEELVFEYKKANGNFNIMYYI